MRWHKPCHTLRKQGAVEGAIDTLPVRPQYQALQLYNRCEHVIDSVLNTESTVMRWHEPCHTKEQSNMLRTYKTLRNIRRHASLHTLRKQGEVEGAIDTPPV